MRKIVFSLLLFVSLSHSHLKAAAAFDVLKTLRGLSAAMAPSLLFLREMKSEAMMPTSSPPCPTIEDYKKLSPTPYRHSEIYPHREIMKSSSPPEEWRDSPENKRAIEVVAEVYHILNTSEHFRHACYGKPVSLNSDMWETSEKMDNFDGTRSCEKRSRPKYCFSEEWETLKKKDYFDGTTSYKIRIKPEYSFSDALDDLLERGGCIGQAEAQLIAMAMVQRELSGSYDGWRGGLTLAPYELGSLRICKGESLATVPGQFAYIPLPNKSDSGIMVFCCKLDKSGEPLYLGFGRLFTDGEPRKLSEILNYLFYIYSDRPRSRIADNLDKRRQDWKEAQKKQQQNFRVYRFE